MARRSAGLLLYRRSPDLEVFLVHPGGPFYARRDSGVWSVPKGELDPGDEPLRVARREFEEETGQSPDRCAAGPAVLELGSVRQAGGKVVEVWAFEGDWPAGALLESSTFELEWPPRSGRRRSFPEVDRAVFFPLHEARRKIVPAQEAFLDRLRAELAGEEP